MIARVYKNLIAQPLYSLLGLIVFFAPTQVSTAASGDPWIEGAKKEGEVYSLCLDESRGSQRDDLPLRAKISVC